MRREPKALKGFWVEEKVFSDVFQLLLFLSLQSG